MNIAISVGHGKSNNGGYDSGAVGGGYHEFRIAREIGKFLKEELKKYDCAYELINYDGDKNLRERIAYIKNGRFDLALELHLNAFNKSANGSEAYYKIKSADGKVLAGMISKNIAKALDAKNRGARVRTYNDAGRAVDYFGFVREIPCESLLIETLFIDSKTDREKLIYSAGQKKCAEAIAKAIADFYKLSKNDGGDEVPQPSGNFKKGDRVKIVGTHYATGQKIPAWVKKRAYTLESNPEVLASGRERALLKEIKSYVFVSDLTLYRSAQIEVGDIVTIKSGAIYGGLSASRGTPVSKTQLAPKKHTVKRIQNNMGAREALLEEINSWVAIYYLSGVK